MAIKHRLGKAVDHMFPKPEDLVFQDKALCVSPAERYWQADIAAIFADIGINPIRMAVEIAIVKALRKRGLCSQRAVNAITRACLRVTPQQVEAEENARQHDIDGLVACIRNAMPETEFHPLVHCMATSFDIRSTADAAALQCATDNVLIPALLNLESDLIKRTLDEADTVQIGRTHLQQASPITVGFWFAEYVQRIYERIVELRRCSAKLRGKFSGAVGAHNDTVLILDDPEQFEREVLSYLYLKPAEYSNQIVAEDSIGDLMHCVVSTAAVLSDLANDIRILLMTEIGELMRELDPGETGSSVMANKVNPSRWENVASLARLLIALSSVSYLNQESNLQRDLRTSAAARVYGEMFVYVTSATRTLTKATAKLTVNRDRLEANLDLSNGQILAAAYNTLFRKHGHPEPHTLMKDLAQQARLEHTSLQNTVAGNPEALEYLGRMSSQELLVLSDPRHYTGIASIKARRVATTVAAHLKIPIAA